MKYFILCCCIGFGICAQSQEFYYFKGEKEYLTPLEDQYFISTPDKGIDNILAEGQWKESMERIDKVGNGVFAKRRKGDNTILNSLKTEFIHSVYKNNANQRLSFTNQIIVKLKKDMSPDRLLSQLNNSEWEIEGKTEFSEDTYVLKKHTIRGNESFAFANKLFESGLVIYAEPNFVAEMPETYVPNDPEVSSQYSVDNDGGVFNGDDGNSGADMNVLNAWDYTTGCSDIVIAIVDNGVSLNHPDLIGNLVPGYDALGQGTNGAPLNGDDHGTPCAGTAAAQGDNGIGVAGIAYNCSIMPIRAFGSQANNNSLAFASAINWAWQNGADIISNSWTWGASGAISDAIENAVEDGRNGLGCLVLASSGNSNNSSAISFPARDPNVIAIGASTMCDERKSARADTTGCSRSNLVPDITGGVSCDNEGCWGSNYSSDLDIMAPGVSVWTTRNSNSYDWFGGTSAACPNAAGVAGLILSAHPDISEIQAKEALLRTARKGGGYTYSNDATHVYGTWNNEMGYGIADAEAAVEYALNSASLFIQNRVYDAGAFSYLANYEIQSGETVSSTQPPGEILVENPAVVHFNAGKRVVLKPGFHVESSADFRARIVNVSCPVNQ